MEKGPRVYRVARLGEPLRIDGDWRKPAWEAIAPLAIDQVMGAKPVHCPRALAKLAWDAEALSGIFHVEDRYVRAVAGAYQDPVCRDSCVEIFFAPGPELDSYFNLEINCGGTLLFWWHPARREPLPVAAEDGARVEIGSTLPRIVDPELAEPTPWNLEFRLPLAVVRRYCPEAAMPAPGGCWRANLYKCADATSHPHWLTWSCVAHPTPRFHLPEYFGALRFA